MEILYISGSPRRDSNTDILLKNAQSETGGQFLKLSNFDIKPCRGCWACLEEGTCAIRDDMAEIIIPMLLHCNAMVLGSPVYFNNVSSILKAFIDRTWCIRGKLRNRIGGAVAVGRGYGIESAITAMQAFFLKHEMIAANRGVSGTAFLEGEISQQKEALEAAAQLGRRIRELSGLLEKGDQEKKNPDFR